MTFGQLEIFAALADAKSFTLAARNLRISQPAVSQALKSLERELQVTLLHREAGQVSLTAIGTQVLRYAREILGLHGAIQQEAAAVRGVKEGSLRIGSFGASSSLRILPDLINAFHKNYPNIDIFIEEAADDVVIQWIEERRVDMGFVVLPNDRFDVVPIATDQFVAVLPQDHGLRDQPNVTLRQLCDDPFIMPESGSVKIVNGLFVDAGLAPKTRYWTTQLLSSLAMVGRGQGVSVMAEMAIPTPTVQDGWITRPLKPAKPRDIGLALHPTATRSPADLAFLQTAKSFRA
ncbi:MAG: LysR family transcriptional regulator [Marinovum sp.]|nr:LysR family transcriptional regulator [Marinovum sp.]